MKHPFWLHVWEISFYSTDYESASLMQVFCALHDHCTLDVWVTFVEQSFHDRNLILNIYILGYYKLVWDEPEFKSQMGREHTEWVNRSFYEARSICTLHFRIGQTGYGTGSWHSFKKCFMHLYLYSKTITKGSNNLTNRYYLWTNVRFFFFNLLSVVIKLSHRHKNVPLISPSWSVTKNPHSHVFRQFHVWFCCDIQ